MRQPMAFAGRHPRPVDYLTNVANGLVQRAQQFAGYSLLEKAESLSEYYWFCKSQFYYRRFFGRIGKGSKILNPMRLKNVRNVFLDDGVIINRGSFLLTRPLPGENVPRLSIGAGCIIGHLNHITCVAEVTIQPWVLTADRVHISDNTHVFADPAVPIMYQEVTSKGPVTIGEGTWIGENASVLSCRIGKHCVIGANSVVITDIPDYCVAVGAPARVVRQLNPASGEWKKVCAGI